jgi:flagella basal body P-ring formation protein FlgA
MKQVSNSLLTLYPIRSTAIGSATGFPRDEVCATGCLLTPFHVHREEKQLLWFILPGRSCPPRSTIHPRLGEGRIRSLLHVMSCPLTAVAVLLLSISVLYGADNLQIRLKEESRVTSGKVCLRDIASLDGTDANLVGGISGLYITDAPEFGTVRTFSRRQIEEIIRRSRDSAFGIRVTGAPIVQIRLQEREARAEEIAPVLKAFIVEKTPWTEEEIEILSIKNLEKIRMPIGESDLRISAKSPVFGKARVLVPFDVFGDGKSLASFWVTAEICVKAAILTAAKRILYGKTITEGDIAKVETEIEDLNGAFLRDADEVIGKVTKHSFSPGDPLTPEFFEKPFLVKSGDTVHLRLERNGLVFTSLARAEQDGRLGQVIRVRNFEFSSVLKAKVTGRAQVEIPD